MQAQFIARTAAVAIALSLATPATGAQTAAGSASLTVECPARPLSVYFASGDAPVSDEVRALLDKIRATAAACHPDRIDITARFDAQVAGSEAELRARSRLALLVNVLLDAGIPERRVHVETLAAGPLTSAAEPEESGRLHIIEVRFNSRVEPAANQRAPGPGSI